MCDKIISARMKGNGLKTVVKTAQLRNSGSEKKKTGHRAGRAEDREVFFGSDENRLDYAGKRIQTFEVSGRRPKKMLKEEVHK